MKDKADHLFFFGGRHRRNEDMDIFEPRGDGSMLEEVGRKSGDGIFWKSTRPRTAKERLTEAEAPRWKTAGQESSPCSENTTCSVSKANRRSKLKRKR